MLARGFALLLALLALASPASAAKTIFNRSAYNATDETSPTFSFRFEVAASTDGAQLKFSRLNNDESRVYLAFRRVPDPDDASSYDYSLTQGGTIDVDGADLGEAGFFYVVVYPEVADYNQRGFIVEALIADDAANLASWFMFLVLLALFLGGGVLKRVSPQLYARTYGLLTAADDIVQECREKLDLNELRRRRVAEAEAAAGKGGGSKKVVAAVIFLALVGAALRFWVLSLNTSMIYSSFDAVSSPLVVSATEFTEEVEDKLGFVGDWVEDTTRELDNLELIQGLDASVFWCEDVKILFNSCIFVATVIVLVAVMRGDLLLYVAIFLDAKLKKRARGRVDKIASAGCIKILTLALLYSIQLGVLAGSRSGFSIMRDVAADTRSCNALGGAVGNWLGLVVFVPLVIASIYFCTFLFGGNRLEPNGKCTCSPWSTGWEPRAPHYTMNKEFGKHFLAKGIDSLCYVRFALQRLLRVSVGYWSDDQVRAYRIEQRALAFDDDDEDSDTRHEEVLRTVGRATSLIWCAIPGCVFIAKLGEAANSSPFFVYDKDLLLHTPQRRRKFMCAVNWTAWLSMMAIVFFPEQVSAAVLFFATAPELILDVYTIVVDELNTVDFLGLSMRAMGAVKVAAEGLDVEGGLQLAAAAGEQAAEAGAAVGAAAGEAAEVGQAAATAAQPYVAQAGAAIGAAAGQAAEVGQAAATAAQPYVAQAGAAIGAAAGQAAEVGQAAATAAQPYVAQAGAAIGAAAGVAGAAAGVAASQAGAAAATAATAGQAVGGAAVAAGQAAGGAAAAVANQTNRVVPTQFNCT